MCLGKASSQYFISFPKQSVVPKQFVDQAVLNVYHDQGAGLGVHQGQLYPFLFVCFVGPFRLTENVATSDPRELFSRPIYSIRLFSDSVLSFGCRGLGMVLRKQAVPLPRGVITVMECYAANKAKASRATMIFTNSLLNLLPFGDFF